MYAALFTRLSIGTASFMTQQVVEALGLEDFEWLFDVQTDVMTYFESFDRQAGHPSVKYPQYSDEGAFTIAVMPALDSFIRQRTAPTGSLGRMFKPKDFLPYHTSILPSKVLPEEASTSDDPMAFMNSMLRSFHAANCLREDRTRATVMMLQDMDRYRTTALKASKKTSSTSLEFLEIGIVDLQMRLLWAGLDEFIGNEGEVYNATCNIWLSFLYESYNSFTWRGTFTATTSNTRLQFLRYTKEIASSLHSVISTAKSEFHFKRMDNLVLMAAELDRVSAIARWDLYSQAPLLNGLAVLELNYQAMYLGINMWNDDGVAGFALHAYNLVLHERAIPHPIPILEMLCTLLLQAVFMSHRPVSNFRSALFRFMGGKLSKSGRPGRSENIPPRGASSDIGRDFFIGAPQNLPRISAPDRRKIYYLHDYQYALSEAMSKCQFEDMWSGRRRFDKFFQAMQDDDGYDEEDRTKHTGRNVMKSLNHVLRGEVEHKVDASFPVTRINPFAVYALSRDILARVWDKAKGVMYTSAELAPDHFIGSRLLQQRAAGCGGAIVATMTGAVDALDGPKSVGRGKKAKQVKAVMCADPKVLMKWVAEAILEAVREEGEVEKYMWKSL